ncbi:MAG: lipid-transfer protein [Pseudomonadales bacterium]|jgi:acetyl-CoA acetyltransferase|nr:lipid-transfer protein [Gammaproteobacteria bacterium]MDP6027561.1 lipid-transfer protein [Pseudomonadales bacterium]MDP6315923.1 lipid-transfer protein [Pseudomonadales bacterium]MDP7314275.1 lipid-transfer protein [Pseudomonadales bacterium]|tara:strand:+ start:864 stop:2048 length:1185 start_codon:yes stop_codon:yes gene_type:complete
MTNNVKVAGVGMIPFTKPGASDDYPVMGETAAKLAIEDAGISYDEIGQAYVGYVYGDSTAGQAALYGLGMTGIPVVNVNNNCATGSSALFLARQAVEAGMVDCALALGFEQMVPGALGAIFTDRPNPLKRMFKEMLNLQGIDKNAPGAAQYFGGAGREYAEEFGTRTETFAKISEKARRHAANNPFAVFRDPLTVEQILESPHIYGPLTRFQCCPPTCGAAAAVVCSEEFARKHGLNNAISIKGQAMTTDFPSTLEEHSMRKLVGVDMAKEAASQVYEQAGIGPEDVQVCELHDCFTANELLTYESLGLTPEGTAEKFIWDGDNTYGGRVVTNPSGGLLSKGHPLGATGLAQCTELVWQLRGDAGDRQVEGARNALQHNLGLGGACVVTMYSND